MLNETAPETGNVGATTSEIRLLLLLPALLGSHFLFDSSL
jgi:hypothetical protein